MVLTPQQVIGPCLDKIVDGASGRKYSKLKTDAKASMLTTLHTTWQARRLATLLHVSEVAPVM